MNIYRLSFVSCLVVAMPCALAVEFNLNVLDKSMRDRIDISLLKEKGVIAPGEYFVSVAVNNNQISNGQKINWHKNDDKTIPCINDLLVDKFGLKPEITTCLPAATAHRMAAAALILTPMEQPESTRGHGAYAVIIS